MAEVGPTVSVVIPGYNAAVTIERALDSVYAQTYDNIIEIIVVDDGSTDVTADLVRDRHPAVTLIQQENGGVSVARNTGVAASSGELIAFLDADDEWLPEKTEKHVAVMQTHPGLALCMCDSMPPDEVIGHAEHHQSPRLHAITYRDATITSRGLLRGCSVWLARRDVIERVPFDPQLRRGEDFELTGRLAGLGYSVAFCDLRLSRYFGSPERVKREGVSAAGAQRSVLLAEKQFGSASRLADGWLTNQEKEALRIRQYRAAADIYVLAGDTVLPAEGGRCSDRLRLRLAASMPRAYALLRRGLFWVVTR